MVKFKIVNIITGRDKGTVLAENLYQAELRCLSYGLDMYDCYMLIPEKTETIPAHQYINEIINR